MGNSRGGRSLHAASLLALVWVLLGAAAATAQTYTLAIDPAAAQVAEGDLLVLTVTVQGCTNPLNTATWSVTAQGNAGSPSPATPGADFGNPVPPQVDLGAGGGLSRQVGVPTVQEAVNEEDESFLVQLTVQAPGVLVCNEGALPPAATQVAAVVTIVDDDPVALTVADPPAVAEGNGAPATAVSFVVTISPAPLQPVSVQYSTQDGTATAADGDYQPASGTLIFDATTVQNTVIVQALGDTQVEPDETFSLLLTAADNHGVLQQPTGTVVLLNDDAAPPPPTIAIADVSLPEGNSGTSQVSFIVTLSAPAAGPVTVQLATQDGTATAGSDYQATSGQLTFPVGTTQQTIAIVVLGDTAPEPNETFSVVLSQPSGATLGDATGIGTIVNDDAAPTPVLSIADASAAEGDSGTAPAVFTVTLSPPASTPVTVAFATKDGSAIAGADYQALSSQLSFAPGQTQLTIEVPVIGDTAVESDETFQVLLSQPSGATLLRGTGQGTILDDDEAPTQSVLSLRPIAAVAEGAQRVVARVDRSAGDGAAQVRITTSPGSAQAGSDFTAQSQVLAWPAGDFTPRSLTIAILDDSVREDDETFQVTLSDPQGASLARPAARTVTILDDDVARSLEAIGDLVRASAPGQQLDLAVRVLGDRGPVVGAAVTWLVAGDAALVGGDSSVSDAQAVASKSVRLGATTGEVIVTATASGVPTAVSFRIRSRGKLADLFDPVTEPGRHSLAQVLDRACADPAAALRAACTDLLDLPSNDQRGVVTALLPSELEAQTAVALEGALVQLRQIGQRLGELRQGGAPRSTTQLSLQLRGVPLPLAALAAAGGRRADPRQALERRLARALVSISRGAPSGPGARVMGYASTAALDEASADPAPEEEAEPGRLGVFLSGSASLGDRPTEPEHTGFDLDTQGLTVGVDYWFSDRLALGLAGGYLANDSRFSRGRGSMEVTGWNVAAYGTYSLDSFYAEGTASWGSSRYQLHRRVDLPVPVGGQQTFALRAEPDGDQLAATLGIGYEAHRSAVTLDTFGRVHWLEAQVDSFAERGGGPFAFTLESQEARSVLGEAGFDLSHAASLRWGVLLSQLRLAAVRELEDDPRPVRGHLTAQPSGGQFTLAAAARDRDYFHATAGLAATLPRGRSLFASYERDFSRRGLSVGTLSAGLRLAF